MGPNGFMTSNNVVPIAIVSQPGSPPIWWWPEGPPGTRDSAGKPSGAGQLLLWFFSCQHPQHSPDSRRAGFSGASGQGPTLAGLASLGFLFRGPLLQSLK